MEKDLKIDSLVIHAGFDSEETTGALMPPIFATSTYLQSAPGEHKGYDYGRSHNKTRYVLEDAICALEYGSKGLAFSSGLAAISTILDLLPANSHVICVDDIYGGTYRLFERVKKPASALEISYCSCQSIAELEQALRPNTKLIWIETPTNPLLKIIDLELVSSFAKKHNLISVCDNTFASCYLQNPIKFGFDIVMHSSTKYINGHSDVIGGLVVVGENSELAEKLAFLQNSIGAVPSPFDCYLTFRGMKTLALRMQRHCDNAEKIVEYLLGQNKVNKVFYPGCKNHPNHEVAAKQMRRFGGMISFEVKANIEQSKVFLSKFKLAKLAESLGGLKTLIEHPALMTHATIPAAQRQALGISDGLIRLSVGAEDASDLIDEMAEAFKVI
jgi:cystathionine beta-lyase/cystathionine gamma-synthase